MTKPNGSTVTPHHSMAYAVFLLSFDYAIQDFLQICDVAIFDYLPYTDMA